MYCDRNTERYSMDYLADLPNMICSILERTTRTAGRLRVVPLFPLARRRMEEDGRGRKRTERMETGLGGGGERTLRGWKRTLRKKKRGSEQDEKDFEKDENGTLRKKKRDSEQDETRTLRRTKQGL